MFTDRFIKFPTDIYNTQLKELTGDAPYEETKVRINPFDISDYYASEFQGEKVVQLCLKNGQKYVINLTMESFENILNKFNA